MTYLAPRQGLFAIIILISFFLQTLLLLLSSAQQLDELKQQTGEQMLVQLTEEAKLPLLNNDKISLSVLAGRYTSEHNVASLIVKDADGVVVLQTGQAKSLSGDDILKPVLLDNEVIGNITLTLRDSNNGEIIASQWLYILGSFILHLLLWLIYGYIARPSKAQLAALSQDIQEHLMVSQPQARGGRGRAALDGSLDRENDPVLHEDDEDEQHNEEAQNNNRAHSGLVDIHYNDDDSAVRAADIDGESAQSERSQLTVRPTRAQVNNHSDTDDDIQSNESGVSDTDNSATVEGDATGSRLDGADALKPDRIKQAMAELQDKQTPSKTVTRKSLDPNRPIEVAVVQIRFYDPSNLMGTLAPEHSKPYLALCTQLLHRTIDELLKQPLLHGISIKNNPVFDAKGVDVEFTSSGMYSKVGLAATMLAKVYEMLNEVTYLKHRELQRFALEIYAGVSDEAVAKELQHLLRNRAEVNKIYALLPLAGIKQLSGHLQLDNLPNPTTVYERDCTIVTGTSDAMVQRLVDVRNAVLLSGQN